MLYWITFIILVILFGWHLIRVNDDPISWNCHDSGVILYGIVMMALLCYPLITDLIFWMSG